MLKELEHRIIARDFGEEQVKFTGQPDPAGYIRSAEGVFFLGQVGAQVGDVGLVCVLRRAGKKCGFNGAAGFKYLPRFIRRGGGDHRALVALQLDNIVPAQQQERAAHGGATDTKHAAKRFFRQLGAGGKALFEHTVAHALADVFLRKGLGLRSFVFHKINPVLLRWTGRGDPILLPFKKLPLVVGAGAAWPGYPSFRAELSLLEINCQQFNIFFVDHILYKLAIIGQS